MANTTIPWSVKSTDSIIGLHYSVQPTARPEFLVHCRIPFATASPVKRKNSGTAYVFLPTQPLIFVGRTTAGKQMRDVREARYQGTFRVGLLQ
jgi:hypothetical protein